MADEPNSEATPEKGDKPKVSIEVNGSPLALQRTFEHVERIRRPLAAAAKQMEAQTKPFTTATAMAEQMQALNKRLSAIGDISKHVAALSKPAPWNGQMLDAFAKQLEEASRDYKVRTHDIDFSKTPQGRQLALLTTQVEEMRMLREEARRDREAASRDREQAHRDRVWGRMIGVAGVLVGVAGILVASVH
jgi:hypothetical protein